MHGILDQPGSYNSGTLGALVQPGAFRSGSLGSHDTAYNSGVLGAMQQSTEYNSGSLGCGSCSKAQAGLGSYSRLLPLRGLGALPISLDLFVGAALVFGGLYMFEKKMGGA